MSDSNIEDTRSLVYSKVAEMLLEIAEHVLEFAIGTAHTMTREELAEVTYQCRELTVLLESCTFEIIVRRRRNRRRKRSKRR